MTNFVHGDNIAQKESSPKKYSDKTSKKYLSEIRKEYDIWRTLNNDLKGPFINRNKSDIEILKLRVDSFNKYKNFLDQKKYAEFFDSRSNLHSSVLEEFMYYLFRDLVNDYSKFALIGKSHAFKDIFFRSNNYVEMVEEPNAFIEKKDHDFVIGSRINASFRCNGMEKEESLSFDIPAVAIECKTYLDKTMLEGASTSGEQLKTRNPNALYIVVAERLKLTEAVNLKKFKVDQIYVLRKQKNTDREYRLVDGFVSNPVYLDVIEHLYNTVREYLETDWHGKIADGLERGYLI